MAAEITLDSLARNDSADDARICAQRLEKYKALVEKLQKEVEINQFSRIGVETLTILLKEAQQDENKEKMKCRRLETAVRVLQTRLVNLKQPADLRIDDMDMLAPSKQLIDRLIYENSSLRLQLQHAGADPKQIHELEKTCNELQNTCQQHELKISEYVQRIDQLEHAVALSENEKDREILRLNEVITKLQEKDKINEGVTQRLNAEEQQLRNDLMRSSTQCAHVVTVLDEKDRLERERHLIIQKWKSSGEREEQLQAANTHIQQLQLQLQETILLSENLREANNKWVEHDKNMVEMEQLDEILAKKLALEMCLQAEEEKNRVNESQIQILNDELSALQMQVVQQFQYRDMEPSARPLINLSPADNVGSMSPYQQFHINSPTSYFNIDTVGTGEPEDNLYGRPSPLTPRTMPPSANNTTQHDTGQNLEILRQSVSRPMGYDEVDSPHDARTRNESS